MEFKVRWKGHGADKDTWIKGRALEKLDNSVIKKYWSRKKARRRQRKETSVATESEAVEDAVKTKRERSGDESTMGGHGAKQNLYRVIQRASVRESADRTSRHIGILFPGEIVSVVQRSSKPDNLTRARFVMAKPHDMRHAASHDLQASYYHTTFRPRHANLHKHTRC